MLVKATPYAFSTVLAVYLAGIALGSEAMRRYLRARPAADIEAFVQNAVKTVHHGQ